MVTALPVQVFDSGAFPPCHVRYHTRCEHEVRLDGHTRILVYRCDCACHRAAPRDVKQLPLPEGLS